MGHESVSTLVLRRVDAARNMGRFYAMSIEPTLIGGRSLVRNWGRMGTQGRYKIELFEDEAAAESAMALSARIKSARGYLEVPDRRSYVKQPILFVWVEKEEIEVPQAAQSWIKR
jgi:predicted DNA-binding WGR domain protein